jgi:hypothetical protein
VAKESHDIELDPSLWDRIDAEGKRSGLGRSKFIENAVQRALAATVLESLFERVRERSDLTPDEALELAAAEKAADRSEARATGDRPDISIRKS